MCGHTSINARYGWDMGTPEINNLTTNLLEGERAYGTVANTSASKIFGCSDSEMHDGRWSNGEETAPTAGKTSTKGVKENRSSCRSTVSDNPYASLSRLSGPEASVYQCRNWYSRDCGGWVTRARSSCDRCKYFGYSYDQGFALSQAQESYSVSGSPALDEYLKDGPHNFGDNSLHPDHE